MRDTFFIIFALPCMPFPLYRIQNNEINKTPYISDKKISNVSFFFGFVFFYRLSSVLQFAIFRQQNTNRKNISFICAFFSFLSRHWMMPFLPYLVFTFYLQYCMSVEETRDNRVRLFVFCWFLFQCIIFFVTCFLCPLFH